MKEVLIPLNITVQNEDQFWCFREAGRMVQERVFPFILMHKKFLQDGIIDKYCFIKGLTFSKKTHYFSWWLMLHICLTENSCGKEREDKKSPWAVLFKYRFEACDDHLSYFISFQATSGVELLLSLRNQALLKVNKILFFIEILLFTQHVWDRL